MKPLIAICFHLGYSNQFLNFAYYLDQIYATGYPVDLYVTYQYETDNLKQISKKYPETIFIRSTRGYDTGAFLLHLKTLRDSGKNYDYIFKIHTKGRYLWREHLLDPMAGSVNQVKTILLDFEQNPNLGLIATQDYLLRNNNNQLLNFMHSYYGIKKTSNPMFVAGTIFWIRWKVLQDFLEQSQINLDRAYLDCEDATSVMTMNSFTHGWERLLGFIVPSLNYHIKGYPSTLTKSELIPIDFNPLVYAYNYPSCPDLQPHEHSRFFTLKCRDMELNSPCRICPIFPNWQTVSEIRYGLSWNESVDITLRIRELLNQKINFSSNLPQYLDDPYVGQPKQLYMNSRDPIILHELHNRLCRMVIIETNPENQLKVKTLASPDSNILECTTLNYMMTLGRNWYISYSLSPFDWRYYSSIFSQDKLVNSHQALSHYLRHNAPRVIKSLMYQSHVNLLDKYHIKLIMTPNHNSCIHTLNCTGLCFDYDPKSTFTYSYSRDFCLRLQTDLSESDKSNLQRIINSPSYLKINHKPIIISPIDPDIPNALWISPRSDQMTVRHDLQLPKPDGEAEILQPSKSTCYQSWAYSILSLPRTSSIYFRGLDLGGSSMSRWKPENITTLCRAKIDQIISDPNPDHIPNYLFITHSNLNDNHWTEIMESLQDMINQYIKPN